MIRAFHDKLHFDFLQDQSDKYFPIIWCKDYKMFYHWVRQRWFHVSSPKYVPIIRKHYDHIREPIDLKYCTKIPQEITNQYRPEFFPNNTIPIISLPDPELGKKMDEYRAYYDVIKGEQGVKELEPCDAERFGLLERTVYKDGVGRTSYYNPVKRKWVKNKPIYRFYKDLYIHIIPPGEFQRIKVYPVHNPSLEPKH